MAIRVHCDRGINAPRSSWTCNAFEQFVRSDLRRRSVGIKRFSFGRCRSIVFGLSDSTMQFHLNCVLALPKYENEHSLSLLFQNMSG